MRKKKPHVATLDEVHISREGEDAVIEFVDESVATMRLKIGNDVQQMTDEEILGHFNEAVLAMQALAASQEHVAREIPPGKPQLDYSEPGDQWVPRGEVLRCIASDGGFDGQLTVYIDDREYSLEEFGRTLVTFAGWGMRITFVPEDELDKEPKIEIIEPD